MQNPLYRIKDPVITPDGNGVVMDRRLVCPTCGAELTDDHVLYGNGHYEYEVRIGIFKAWYKEDDLDEKEV